MKQQSFSVIETIGDRGSERSSVPDLEISYKFLSDVLLKSLFKQTSLQIQTKTIIQ